MDDHLAFLSQAPLPWHKHQWQRLLKQRQELQLAHAYLLSGAGGLGKFLFAYRFAQSLLCVTDTDGLPCGQCRNCQMGGESFHPDVLVVAPEEGSRAIKVEQIRALSDFATRTSHAGLAKVVIVRDAHRMNTAAANALLKTLEEPAGNTYLFLVSDLPGYLSATIRSRCQRLQFAVPSLELGSAWLQQQVPADVDAGAVLVAAGGRPLEALALIDGGVMESQQQFLQTLAQTCLGKSSPQTLVSLGLKLGESVTIEYFSTGSTILIKALLGYDGARIQDSGLGPLYETLKQQRLEQQAAVQHRASARMLAALMRLYQDSLDARRQLLSGANPNPQLLLESLSWRWSGLLA